MTVSEGADMASEIRTAVFLPQYIDADGELRGLGTGYVAIEFTPLIAERMGVPSRVIGYPTPPSVVDALETGGCDLAFMGIEPARVSRLDFSPAIFEFDYTLLVPAGSPIESLHDAKRMDVPIGVVDGHASAMALRKIAKGAHFLAAELPEDGFELLRAGKVAALACPRDVLLDFQERLPGSRVLAEGYGVNRVGIAMRKGSPFLDVVVDFVQSAKASGLVERVIEQGALRGFRVASAEV
jgi:polar amino acid transport system substrate-binding protein